MPIEPKIEPYNAYDPKENELLLIEPSWDNPVMDPERIFAFVNTMNDKLSESWEFIRIRQAMEPTEYITSSNYYCQNPAELVKEINAEPVEQSLPEEPAVSTQDFEPEPKLHNKKIKPVPA